MFIFYFWVPRERAGPGRKRFYLYQSVQKSSICKGDKLGNGDWLGFLFLSDFAQANLLNIHPSAGKMWTHHFLPALFSTLVQKLL